MIEAQELAGGVWVFRGAEAGRNFCVATTGASALLVDPGLADAVQRFLAEAELRAEGVAYTQRSLEDAARDAGEWPGLPAFAPGTFSIRTPLPAPFAPWVALPPVEVIAERMMLFQPKERVLLCGDLLAEPGAGVPRLQGGAEPYMAWLEAVEQLQPKLVVPWRGAVATGKRAVKARIDNDRGYIQSLVRHIGTSAASGIPLQRLLDVAADLYDDFPYLPDHLDNMRHLWAEWGDSNAYLKRET